MSEEKKTSSGKNAAILNSHKKTMQRSVSAPSVAQDNLDDAQKKRNRTTPDQLQILEDIFLRSPTPNSQLRDAIAQKVGMSPRSVQVWFQNRRAKEKKCLQNQQEMEASKAHSLFYNPYQMIGGPHMVTPFVAPRLAPNNILGAEVAAFGFSSIPQPMAPPVMPSITGAKISTAEMPGLCLPVDKLKIGTWTRIAMNDSELMCGIDNLTNNFSWIVVEGPYRCKIEFPFSDIIAIDAHIANEGFTFITIQIGIVPRFFLEVRMNSERTVWKVCNDITEGKQASTQFKHSIQMSTTIFREEVLPAIQSNIVLHKSLHLKDDTLQMRPFENKIDQSANINANAIAALPESFQNFALHGKFYQEDEKIMKKSISVPTLPLVMPRFSEPIREYNYNIHAEEEDYVGQDIGNGYEHIEDSSSWSRQSEIGSYSHIDLDSLGLPSLGSSNSFSSIGSSTLAASLEESNENV